MTVLYPRRKIENKIGPADTISLVKARTIFILLEQYPLILMNRSELFAFVSKSVVGNKEKKKKRDLK